MSLSYSSLNFPPPPGSRDYIRPTKSRDVGDALHYRKLRRKPNLSPRKESSRQYEPHRFFHRGRPVPYSVVHGAEIIEGYECKKKDALLIRLQNRGDLPMSEAPPIVPKDHSDHTAFTSRYYHFIRALPNEEIEYLVGFFYDRWLWDTDADSDKESFEIFLKERERRKEHGWRVIRPTREEAKRTYQGTFVDDRTKMYILLSRELGTPDVMPGYGVHLDLIVDIFTKYGILNSPSLIEYINGFLRRIP